MAFGQLGCAHTTHSRIVNQIFKFPSNGGRCSPRVHSTRRCLKVKVGNLLETWVVNIKNQVCIGYHSVIYHSYTLLFICRLAYFRYTPRGDVVFTTGLADQISVARHV